MSDSLIRHFRLTAHPFGRDASPSALHRHRGFTEAHERLRYTIELDGLSALVAEPGCGKSLLLGQVAAEQQKLGTQVHYFAHATVGPFGLLNVLDLHADARAGGKALHSRAGGPYARGGAGVGELACERGAGRVRRAGSSGGACGGVRGGGERRGGCGWAGGERR